MFRKLQERWKVNGLNLMLILSTFAWAEASVDMPEENCCC